MKLYAVMKQEYEDIDIAGIFDTKEQAEKIINLLNDICKEDYFIEEMELNKLYSYQDKIINYFINIYDTLGMNNCEK